MTTTSQTTTTPLTWYGTTDEDGYVAYECYTTDGQASRLVARLRGTDHPHPAGLSLRLEVLGTDTVPGLGEIDPHRPPGVVAAQAVVADHFARCYYDRSHLDSHGVGCLHPVCDHR